MKDLQFEDIYIDGAAAVGGAARGGRHAFPGGAELAYFRDVLAPRAAPGRQALIVPVQDPSDDVGKQIAVGLLGVDVHGTRPVIVGGDAAKVMRC